MREIEQLNATVGHVRREGKREFEADVAKM
jgi:hypothetical protein